ncbi:hypothetical protein LIER_41192 [Lithospermum erythrorhizon]|uniref:ATP-dependent DNA helicase n=1 Tax=Lithospermum erythrorhizon TaxID=34254 RepID=A0AAV3R6U6_LITER
MTCNSNWPEIRELLQPGDESHNRPDLLARVFKAKLSIMHDKIMSGEIFGQVASIVHVIEFQKRGLPHAHFLIILKPQFKLLTPEAYDRIVCAELPDQAADPYFYSLVVKHMMHGPYGDLNPSNVCMKNRKCKNHYTKEFSEYTTHGMGSYPIYRRRNDKRIAKVRGKILDNRWVIPYNPTLLLLFNCHISVEICCDIRAVKYLYKYVYKGHDKVMFHITSDTPRSYIDEIRTFQNARWVSPVESAWRIFGFPLHGIFLASLIEQLRCLTSYNDLLMVGGIMCETFLDAAYKRGLLHNDDDISKTMEDASTYRMPSELRRLFATLLHYCRPSNVRKLFDEYYEQMAEHFTRLQAQLNLSDRDIRHKVLQGINDTLESLERDVNKYHLVSFNYVSLEFERYLREIIVEKGIHVPDEDLHPINHLNVQHRYAFDTVFNAAMLTIGGIFFVDGLGGTGKSFLYNVLLAHIRSKGYIVLIVVSLGIASSGFLDGRTTHSRFKIPIDAGPESNVKYGQGSNRAENMVPRRNGPKMPSLVETCRKYGPGSKRSKNMVSCRNVPKIFSRGKNKPKI